jgi:hypothetical protein
VKEAGTKGAGISDAIRRTIRCAKGNPCLRAPKGRPELMAHEALIQQDGFGLVVAAKSRQRALAPQSIIAALRMQTIVAWAGFALKLRMR